MWTWLRDLDRIMRGEATRLPALRRGTIEVPMGGVSVGIIALGMVYGLCMGCFALFGKAGPNYMQLLASTLKVPLLFFMTLLVTYPSLYVFNALVGSRLSALSVLRLLVASLGVTLVVLAAIGPIVAFFSWSTTNYAFILLLNVVVFAVAGLLGLKFLLQTLHRLSVAQRDPPSDFAFEPVEPSAHPAEPTTVPPVATPHPEPRGALDHMEGSILAQDVRTIFYIWVVVYGLVGAQMGWVLRPFVGTPDRPFEWFRGREASFFEGVLHALRNLGG